MRAAPTEGKRVVWRLLLTKRLARCKWRRQQPIVEANGSQHLDSAYDGRRDAWREAEGFRLLRSWSNDIPLRSEAVTTVILSMLDGEANASPTPLPGPLPQGEREKKD